MTTRAADGQDVRQALHQAVRDLFEQNGYAGTHIRDITDKAGVALSTFYATYGSKKQAWHATMGNTDETADGEAPHGRAAQTRAALIDAARDVIERDGYHAARITDIAEQAGTAIGSFYHHFSGKQAVFTAVMHEHLATLHNTAGTGSGGGGRDTDDTEVRTLAEQRAHAIQRVNAAIDRYLDDYPGHTSLLLLRLDEAIGTHPELIELRLAVHRHFASAIATSLRRWQAAGIADATLDADHAGDALAAMVGHATRVWRLFGSPYDRDVASRNLTALWCNGVGLTSPE
jgi:AcrR family transcriptional regulator